MEAVPMARTCTSSRCRSCSTSWPATPGRTAFRIGCDRCATTTLLILDETGYVPLDRVATSFLFQLVSERYIKGSIIITSNKSHVELGLGVRG